MFLLFGAFIAGMLTVLAPCVLPLLPIIIGGSIAGDTKDKKRPLIIAASLAVSLIVFTLLLKATTLLIAVPPQVFTIASGIIIIALGIATLFPSVYARLIARLGIEQNAQKTLSKGYNDKRRFIGAVITGAALGPVFSSCSPVYAYILASVLPVNFAQAMVYIVAYVLGLSLVLLAVGYYGQRFIGRIRFASDPKGWFQRVLAIIFIIVGLMIMTGYDKQFQTFISEHTPFNFDALSSQFLPASKNKIDTSKLFNVDAYKAPELTGLTSWINSKPQTLAGLKGKVVLVDFWTYSCINCIRNNPYIEGWYNNYKDSGFTVIGVHAPEFAFERLAPNVQQAVKDQHITYPVALDNDYGTWNAFNNQSWPAGYLIDASGNVRRIHLGEGEYAEEEQAIRQLLTDNGATNLPKAINTTEAVVPITNQQTPETYLGSDRASNYAGSPALGAASVNTFSSPATLPVNGWALGGTWQIDGDKIIAKDNSTIKFHVAAKDVYLVGGSSTPQTVHITLDSTPVSNANNAGSDVNSGIFTMGESRLYRIVHYPQFNSSETIELTVPNGVELNTFTFGS